MWYVKTFSLVFCRYINYAKEAKASTRCFHFEVSFEHALHNEKVRQLSQPVKGSGYWVNQSIIMIIMSLFSYVAPFEFWMYSLFKRHQTQYIL